MFKVMMIILFVWAAILSIGGTDELQPTLSIQLVTDNNGYAIVQTIQKPLIDKYFKILHIFNITEYTLCANIIENSLNLLDINANDPINLLVKEEYSDLKHNLRTLTLNKRQKRGLINFGGTIFKYIIGTMDDDDAQEIFSHLDNLDANIKNSITEINNQVTINEKLIKTVSNTREHVNNQTKIIKQYLYDIKNTTNNVIEMEENLQRIFQIFLSIQKMNKVISKFSDVILLSKLGLLAHDIFTDEELIKYNLTINKLQDVKSNVMFVNDIVVLVLKIPQFTNKEYIEALIIPIPNKRKEELNVPITKIIINDKNIFEYTDETIKENKLKPIKLNNLITTTLSRLFNIYFSLSFRILLSVFLLCAEYAC